MRCEYCGRRNNGVEECRGCGAPLPPPPNLLHYFPSSFTVPEMPVNWREKAKELEEQYAVKKPIS